MQNRHSEFDGQFLIFEAERPIPSGWITRQLTRFSLALSPTTRCATVYDCDGRQVGVLIGTAIDLDTRTVIAGDYVIELPLEDDAGIDNFVETGLYRLAGSFLFILDAAGKTRIYLDANGSLSLVFDTAARTAAATSAVLLGETEYESRFRKDMYDALDVENAGWFTAGLTAHRGVRRLLCNHYLDLDCWTVHRHWPLGVIETAHDAISTYQRICDRVTRTIDILADDGRTSVALTAGFDSRLLLACCRNLLDRVSFVTVDAPAGEVDVAVARKLARLFGLRHEVLPYREATPKQIELWRLRAGHCVGGNNVKLHPSVVPLEGRYFVGGLGGEIGRGFLWLSADQKTPLDARDLVARMKLPQHPEVIREVEVWLEPLAQYDTLYKLDLAYMELRMSAWGFCDSYVKPRQNEIHPMVSRANYVDMLSISPDSRRKGRIFTEAIATLWPDILSQPINRFGDWRDNIVFAKKILRNPRRAKNKVAQLILTFKFKLSRKLQ